MAIDVKSAVIVGGGPVGLILAIALAKQRKAVTVIEKNCLRQGEVGSFDGRVLALSYGSMQFLEKLGLGDALQAKITPIEHVHVSQKGYLGLTYLHADEMNTPALGYSITAADLGAALWETVNTLANIEVFSGAGLVGFALENGFQAVTFETKQHLEKRYAQLIVGADGTQSAVRKQLDLPMTEKSYHAFGVISQVTTAEPAHGWAFERFTQTGPVALLPMQGKKHKAVWVVPEAQIDAVRQMDDAAFLAGFTEQMGERFGGFTAVSQRVIYPLIETYVPNFIETRAVLIGNAAHTQHPVAAQGLNLGIADIQQFVEMAQAVDDLGDANFLLHYAQARHRHHQSVMGLTDSLIQLFQTSSPVVGHFRGLGLMAMHSLAPLRKRFASFSMGLNQHG
ncbi:MAG: ubiquinone biosynthesis protein [Thiomicrospira sp. CG2_30_44_34]|nr:MAG: ubiquinone biosynthesis protein [Thiomicrospira sp. CG2_30_44_34]